MRDTPVFFFFSFAQRPALLFLKIFFPQGLLPTFSLQRRDHGSAGLQAVLPLSLPSLAAALSPVLEISSFARRRTDMREGRFLVGRAVPSYFFLSVGLFFSLSKPSLFATGSWGAPQAFSFCSGGPFSQRDDFTFS